MQLVQKAQEIAQKAHGNQQYHAGPHNHPYFEGHLKPVAALVETMGYGEKTIAAAYLHDVLEDTTLNAEDLTNAGIPGDVVEAVSVLTYNKGVSLEVYRTAISKVPRAIPVKVADSTFNLETTERYKEHISEADYIRRKDKYEKNLAFLRPLLPSPGVLND